MPMNQEREYRTLQANLESNENIEHKEFDSEYYVEGYATRFSPYVLYEDAEGPVYELFTKDAFIGTDMSDVIMQYDHNGKVLARQRNNTLKITIDDEGIRIAADLSKSEASRSLYEEIKNGLVDRMSWGFIGENPVFDKKTRTIKWTKIKKMFDVSAVSIPANENTNINARAFVDGEIDKMRQELIAQEELRTKTLLKLKLGGF